jgi:arylformamidase
MAAIDYEAEYDNRARVPDWETITARWSVDADRFLANAGWTLDIPYGQGAREKMDIFGDGEGPVLMFIHGGYWRSRDRKDFSHLAAGPAAHGLTVALPSYDLCPQVRIGTIVGQVRQAAATLYRRYGRRLAVAGHSAGGHLAAAVLATDWTALAPDLPDGMVTGGYAISGLFDLTPMLSTSLNADLRLDAAQVHALSPVGWPAPVGLTLDAVVGGDESSEFLRQSRIITDAWRLGGAVTRYEAVPGANHFTVIAPLADAQSAMTMRVVELARAAAAAG